MALLIDGMPCAICGAPIVTVATEEVFATTYFRMRDSRFQHLDDAAMHQHCIDSWEHRDAFVAYYNETCQDELRVSKNGHVVYERRKGIRNVIGFGIRSFMTFVHEAIACDKREA